MERREIVGFFVNVENVRPRVLEDSGNPGVMVYVEMPVPPRGLYNKPISLCVQAFEGNGTALVPPKRRNDDGEVESRLLSKSLEL